MSASHSYPSVTQLPTKNSLDIFLHQLYTTVWPFDALPTPHNPKIFTTDSILVSQAPKSPLDPDAHHTAASIIGASDGGDSVHEQGGGHSGDEATQEDSTQGTGVPFTRTILDFTRPSSYNMLTEFPKRLLVRQEYDEFATFADSLTRNTILTG
ncbi:hypothetical protein BKA93DRAFT_128394 [Sparassis latifolia]